MKREYHKWHSACLRRDMELIVFGHAGARVIVFPARMGRFYDYENWRIPEILAPTINAGNLQLFCVDSIDAESLYSTAAPPPARLARHLDYESYILEEVIPFSHAANPNPFLVAHGCSLGAYHAVNIAFRHPERFGKVVALSGRYDLTVQNAHYRDLFDGFYDDVVYFHTPSHFIPGLDDDSLIKHLKNMEIILAVGGDDPLFANNKELADALHAKGIAAQFHVWEGDAHRPRFWRKMVRHYL